MLDGSADQPKLGRFRSTTWPDGIIANAATPAGRCHPSGATQASPLQVTANAYA